MLKETAVILHEHGKNTYFHNMWVVCWTFGSVTYTVLASA